MRKTRMEKGITLIALIITIVVLLILAVVAINSIKNDGILSYAGNAANDYNKAASKEQGMLDYYEGYLAGTLWEQDGTTVTRKNTDGTTTTLNVGQTVTGYTSPEGTTDPGWAVLGAENGKLLLVSKSNVQDDVYLGGKEGGTVRGTECVAGYNNGITYLNSLCEPYLNSSLADEARSIKVEDINRVTGYDPTNQKNGKIYGAGETYQYGNTVTYTLNSEGKVVYTSDKATGSDASADTSSYTSFDHVDGRTLTATSDPIKVTSNIYYYKGATYLTATTSDAYKVLFKKANGTTNNNYWLASQYQNPFIGVAAFGLRVVESGYVRDNCLWRTDVDMDGLSCGVRAVVSLQFGVNISSSGVIS